MPKKPELKVKRIKPPSNTDDEAKLRLWAHDGLQTDGSFPTRCGIVQDAINGPVIPHNRRSVGIVADAPPKIIGDSRLLKPVLGGRVGRPRPNIDNPRQRRGRLIY